MQRRKFIKNSCSLCVGLTAGISLVTLLDSCVSGRILKLEPVNEIISINTSEFTEESPYVTVRTKALNFDLFVHKSDGQYTALLMQCTHYDNPVYANTKEIFCPTHGSKFDFSGKVLTEPASTNLKTYPVSIEANQIKINIK